MFYKKKGFQTQIYLFGIGLENSALKQLIYLFTLALKFYLVKQSAFATFLFIISFSYIFTLSALYPLYGC